MLESEPDASTLAFLPKNEILNVYFGANNKKCTFSRWIQVTSCFSVLFSAVLLLKNAVCFLSLFLI